MLAYVLIPGVSELINPWIKQISLNSRPGDTPLPASPTSSATQPTPSAVASSDTPELIQLKGNKVPLLRLHTSPSPSQPVIGVIPAGSLLQIINRSSEQQQDSWLELRVCAATGNVDAQPPKSQSQAGKSPAANSKQPVVTYRQVKQGDSGWIREGDVVPLLDPNFTPTAAQQQECTSVTTSPTPTPKPSQSP